MNSRVAFFFAALVYFTAADVCARHADGKPERAKAYTGNVAVMEKGKLVLKQEPLPAFDKGWFRTALLHFEPLPEMEPDKDGCFCYQPPDKRFQYVQLFFHLSRQLRHANELLKAAKVAPLADVEIRLKRADKGSQPGGESDTKAIDFFYDDEPIEPSASGHEVGHLIQLSLARHPDGTPTDVLAKANLQASAEYWMILEGAANVFGTLDVGHPVVAGNWFKGAPVTVDALQKWPDVTTRAEVLRQRLRSDVYKKAYPETAKLWEKELKNKDEVRYPEPYVASAVFTQPLWEAAKIHGRPAVEAALVAALPITKKLVDVPSFAKELVRCSDPKLAEYLTKEFRARKLLP